MLLKKSNLAACLHHLLWSPWLDLKSQRTLFLVLFLDLVLYLYFIGMHLDSWNLLSPKCRFPLVRSLVLSPENNRWMRKSMFSRPQIYTYCILTYQPSVGVCVLHAWERDRVSRQEVILIECELQRWHHSFGQVMLSLTHFPGGGKGTLQSALQLASPSDKSTFQSKHFSIL